MEVLGKHTVTRILSCWYCGKLTILSLTSLTGTPSSRSKLEVSKVGTTVKISTADSADTLSSLRLFCFVRCQTKNMERQCELLITMGCSNISAGVNGVAAFWNASGATVTETMSKVVHISPGE